ncbi:MAG: serine/threonine-protein kinase [Myxococcota bacterium]
MAGRSSLHTVGTPPPTTRTAEPVAGLDGVKLEADRVEVRLTRAAVKARLFGRPPQATQIGRFVVLERVGMGGMGIVYAAYDPQLDRRIALKVMRDDLVRSRRTRQQGQLLREARAMAKLSHPNVVAVYDAGTIDGQVFVAMEFVEADTLRQWMAQERSTAERLRIFEQAGRGLATAHAAGLVHRDFKPENVLVPREGAVRVTDFGIARAIDPDGAARSGLAWPAYRSGMAGVSFAAAGTPPYMSPQQMRGEAVDARADQWAFCVALYEAFAGHRPFDGDALRQLARGEPVPVPPMPDGTAVPARVLAAIERGLAVEPEERFADMPALLAMLEPSGRSRGPWVAAVVGGLVTVGGLALMRTAEPTCPRAISQLSGVWDAPTRRRTAESLGAASPALGADAWQRIEPMIDAHVEQWLDLRQSSCRAAEDGMLSSELLDLRIACLDDRHGELRALVDTLGQADPEIVSHAVESTLRLTPLTRCVDPKILRELTPPRPRQELREASGQLRARVDHARALRRAGKAAEGLALVDPAVAEAEALGEPGVSIEARLERGRIRAELADRDGAIEDFDAVIEQGGEARYLQAVAEASVALVDVVGVDLARVEAGLDLARVASVAISLGGGDTLMRSRLQLARGRVLYLAGRTGQGQQATQRGLEALSGPRASERARLEQASELRLLAKLALARDDHARGQEYARRSRVIFEQLLGPEHPQVAATLAHSAAAALRTGAIDEAREQFERAAQIQRRAYGEAHPVYGRTIGNLGSAKRAGGDRQGALDSYRRSVEILERSLGADDPRVGSLWINIGGTEADLGHNEAAERAYQRGLKALRASVGEEHPQTALALANMGRLELARGDVEAARRALRRALEIRERRLGPAHIETARSRGSLADALAAAGELDAAAEAYQQVLAVLEAGQAPPAELALARADLGRVLWRQGARARARALLEQARPSLVAAEREKLDAWCNGRC